MMKDVLRDSLRTVLNPKSVAVIGASENENKIGGRPLLYAPNPFAGGSSVSHYDVSAFPNALMEPNINADLTNSLVPPLDLTLPLLKDIGW